MFTYDDELFSDLHKDAVGFRPRGHEFYAASRSRKQEIWDSYVDQVNVELAREHDERQASKIEFEGKIADLISIGAGDRETAIRWLLTSDEDNLDEFKAHGVSWALYEFNLPIDYSQEFGDIRNEMVS